MNIDNNPLLIKNLPAYIQVKTKNLIAKKNSQWYGENNRKENLFAFATQHLYTPLAEQIINLNAKKVVICGRVADDGVGDYYHMVHTAEQIKKLYPTLNISIIPHFDANPIPANLRILDPTQFHTLLYSSDAHPQIAQEKIKAADLMLDVSLASIFDKNKNHLMIGEYGLGMGVSDLELGIAIKEKPATTSLIKVKNVNLKQCLFNTEQPNIQDLENYVKNHDLFSAYLKMGTYFQMGLLYTLAALTKNSPKQTLDICIPDVDMNILDFDGLKKQGIGKLTTMKWAQGQLFKKELQLSEQGKEMRLINPYPMSQEDFHALVLNSHPLIGCTGDNSISEVLSFDRIPFYEIIGVKGWFWSCMKRLAGDLGAPAHYLKKYFEELSNITSTQSMAATNKLRMFYDRLPTLTSWIKDWAQTLESTHKELEALEMKDAHIIKAKGIIVETRLLYLEIAQDFLKVYLDGKKSNNPIFDKAKELQKKFKSVLADLGPINEQKPTALSSLLKKAEEGIQNLVYVAGTPEGDGVGRFKAIQPKLVESGERIAALLQNPELHKELAEFTHLLKTQYNYNLVLKDLIGRKFALQAYPELESYEKELFEKFDKDQIDIFTAHQLLKEKIATIPKIET